MKGLTIQPFHLCPYGGVLDASDSSRSAVDPITDNGITEIRQMDTDLVGTSRLDSHFQQGGRTETLPDTPDAYGVSTPPAYRRHLLAIRRMPPHGRLDPPSVGPRIPVNEGQVNLFHLVTFELFRQPPMGRIGFGRHEKARGPFVQAVDNPGAKDAAYSREVPAVVEEGIDQRPACMTGRRVDDHPRRLVDDEEVVVLVGDPEVERLVLEFGLDDRGRIELQILSAP